MQINERVKYLCEFPGATSWIPGPYNSAVITDPWPIQLSPDYLWLVLDVGYCCCCCDVGYCYCCCCDHVGCILASVERCAMGSGTVCWGRSILLHTRLILSGFWRFFSFNSSTFAWCSSSASCFSSALTSSMASQFKSTHNQMKFTRVAHRHTGNGNNLVQHEWHTGTQAHTKQPRAAWVAHGHTSTHETTSCSMSGTRAHKHTWNNLVQHEWQFTGQLGPFGWQLKYNVNSIYGDIEEKTVGDDLATDIFPFFMVYSS